MKYVLLTILLMGLISCSTHKPNDDGIYPVVYTGTNENSASESIVFLPVTGDISPRERSFIDQATDKNRVYLESDGNLKNDTPIDLFDLSSPVVLP